MITKQILRSVLLVIALGCFAIWANRAYHKPQATASGSPPPAETVPVLAGDQVVMTYFISGERCESCKKIEDLAKETAEKDFAAELANHKIVFRVVDTGEPANAHYISDYQLTSKIVIISHRVDGKETEWVAMEKVWDLLDDPAGFRAYLAAPIRKYLGT
jgi:thiol-disulfide isomerase/thioredoxin